MWALIVHFFVRYRTNYFLQFSNIFRKPIWYIKMQLWYWKFRPFFFPSHKFQWENAGKKLFADDSWGSVPGLAPSSLKQFSLWRELSSCLPQAAQPRLTLSVRLRFSLRSFSSTSMFSIPESTSTWDILQVERREKPHQLVESCRQSSVRLKECPLKQVQQRNSN